MTVTWLPHDTLQSYLYALTQTSEFYKQWRRTPPKSSSTDRRRRDPDRGLEHVGRYVLYIGDTTGSAVEWENFGEENFTILFKIKDFAVKML